MDAARSQLHLAYLHIDYRLLELSLPGRKKKLHHARRGSDHQDLSSACSGVQVVAVVGHVNHDVVYHMFERSHCDTDLLTSGSVASVVTVSSGLSCVFVFTGLP